MTAVTLSRRVGQLATIFDAVNTSGRGAVALLTLLFLVGVVITVPLVDRYFAHSFEADAESTVTFVTEYSRVLTTWRLSAPVNYPPYFDGQYVIYAVVASLISIPLQLGLIPAQWLSSPQSIAICAIRLTNAASHVAAAAFIFLVARMVSRSNIVAFVTGVLVLLSPQILMIDLMRIDHIVIVLLAALLFFCVRCLHTGPTKPTLLLIGVLTGALAMTKITSVVFAAIPAMALAMAWRALTVRKVILVVVTSVATAAALSVRYLIFEWVQPGLTYSSTIAKYEVLKQWSSVMAVTPYLYYSYQGLLTYGAGFVLLTWVGATAVVLSGRISSQSSRLVAYSGIVYASLAIPAWKYARGGYHLEILQILAFAAAIPLLSRILATRVKSAERFATLVAMVLLIPPAANVIAAYRSILHDARNLQQSVAATRVVPREWLRAHIPSGARVVGTVSSDWTLPPLDGLGYRFSYAFLTFPYLDKNRMAAYLPPESEKILQEADVILLSDLHKAILLSHVRTLGLDSVADRWERFFATLRVGYPHIVFDAASPNYGVRSIEVYVVNPHMGSELVQQGVLTALVPPR